MMVSMAGCHSRPAIQNSDLDHYRHGKFVNLYKPVYGYGYHQSDLDELEYLKPDEIEKKHYTFIYAHEPAKQINRTKNMELLSWDMNMCMNRFGDWKKPKVA